MVFRSHARKFGGLGWMAAVLAMAGGAHGEAVFTGSGAVLSGNIAVDATRGVVRGGNLFHSFSVFNVLTGETAVFTGPPEIRNVISRVTGGTSDITGLKSSLIDGPLSVAISGANFYFINPNGVVIGENGAFNVSGSVFLSTADSLRLADGGVFHADAAKNSVLTTADPVAFGFLSATPAPITLNGPWLGAPYTPAPVLPGKTFALVGGDIVIQAGAYGNAAIVAPGATVSLASVASAGEALIGAGGVLDLSGFATLGHVQMSGSSFIDVGDPPQFDGDGNFLGFADSGASGSIVIRADQLSLAPAGLLAQTHGDADGGGIDIAVRGDLLARTDADSGIVSVLLAGSYGGLGKGAGIRLDVGGTLAIEGGSFVISESYGPGAAGDIRIRAGAIEIRGQGPGSFTGISADNYDTAAGPSLSITTGGSLALRNGGFVGTRNLGPGTGGALSIAADSIVASGAIDPDTGQGVVTLSLSTETTGGAAGHMSIHTRTLTLADGARISSSTGGPGAAGDLNIDASASVDITGGLSGIFTATSFGATGHAGTLRVVTPVLRMEGGVIDSTTVGDGNAGAVEVSVGSLQLAGGAQIRSFSGGFDETNGGALVVGSGNAGSVNVVVSGQATIAGSAADRPSGLVAETRGSGEGGALSLQAAVLRLTDGATISSSSLGSGRAGNVDIRVSDSLDMQDSLIATAAGLFGTAGTLRVTAPVLRMSGGALDSTTIGDGNAGAIEVNVGSLQLTGGAQIRSFSGIAYDFGSVVVATGGRGNAGDVSVVVRGDATLSGSGPDGASGLVAETRGSGAGGNVSLQASVLRLTDGATISSSSLGSGRAGNIDIRVSDSLDMQDSFIASAAGLFGTAGTLRVTAPVLRMHGGALDSTTIGDGDAGAIEVSVGSLQLSGGAQIRSFSGTFYDFGSVVLLGGGRGNAGDVNVVVSGGATLSGSGPDGASGLVAETRGSGAGGDISLQASTLRLSDGAEISSSSLGSGQAGRIDIRISDSLDIQDSTIATAAASSGNAGTLRVTAPVLRMDGGALDSTTIGDGNAGAVDIRVGSLLMTGGAQIRSFSGDFDEDNGRALVVGSGNAGRVDVVVSGEATMRGSAPGRPSGLFAETRGSGAGGDVSLQAAVLQLTDGATISSSSLGSGVAGNIEISLSDSLEMRGSSIATRAATSDGGNITVLAPRLIRLTDSQITTSVQSGVGGGGNIFIDPQFVVLQNSQIVANAFGGPGGNIRIVAGQLIADPATAITASSALGIDGSVNIDAPDTDVSAGLAVLPASFLDAASLLRAGCSGARAGLSSLVEVGRGGLPPDPDGYLPSMGLGIPERNAGVASRSVTSPRIPAGLPAAGLMASLSVAGCAR